MEDIEWRITQAFCNAVLKRGMIIVAERLMESNNKFKRTIEKVVSWVRVNRAYQEIRNND